MSKELKFELNEEMIDNIQTFSALLKKDVNVILTEALEDYFAIEQKKLLEKNLENDNAMTNLDYDEFWDGVDI